MYPEDRAVKKMWRPKIWQVILGVIVLDVLSWWVVITLGKRLLPLVCS